MDGWTEMKPYEHVVSVSGGKDSTALYLLAIERGRPFTAVFADTGNEHEWTYDYVRELPGKTGGPEIRWVKSDFSREVNAKREYVAKHWAADGVPQARVDEALALLHPTGNPFVDLCMTKTRFPSSMVRFCTEELKIAPMFHQVQRPLLDAGCALISWQGVRAQESFARSTLPKWQRIDPVPYSESKAVKAAYAAARAYAYRPLIDWKVEDVWAMHAKHGLARNALYDHGMSRVGCMPCIMARKGELSAIAAQFPEHIDRIERWEKIIGAVSKNGTESFIRANRDPTMVGVTVAARAGYGIRDTIEWSRTGRGGRQLDLLTHADMNTACNQWGACE